MLGNIPEEDECPSVQIGALTITVQVEEQRITRLRVENMEPIAGEASERAKKKCAPKKGTHFSLFYGWN